MMKEDNDKDIDIVTHGLMIFALACVTSGSLIFEVPALFNQHTDEGNIEAVALAIGMIVFAYLGGRYIWRSASTVLKGDDE